MACKSKLKKGDKELMGPSGGGLGRGSGEAHVVSDFRFIFLHVGVGISRGKNQKFQYKTEKIRGK